MQRCSFTVTSTSNPCITRHTSHVTRHTSHEAHHTSHVERHTSIVTRSNMTRDLQHESSRFHQQRRRRHVAAKGKLNTGKRL